MATHTNTIDWARLDRPDDFDSYVGNSTLKKTMKTLLSKNAVPQCMLFYGPSGGGKTTIGRIIAKHLICPNRTEEGLACNTCLTCQKINETFIGVGASVQGLPLYEIDANSSGKKENIIEMVEDMKKAPVHQSKKKIYMIDESQAMQGQAQDALLKAFEEPKPWVYIMMFTTHPQNLKEAIMTRMTKFEVRVPTKQELTSHLESICIKRGVNYQTSALEAICKVAKYSVREAMKGCQLVSETGDITYDRVFEVLDAQSIDSFVEYVQNIDSLSKTFTAIENSGLGAAKFLDRFSSFVTSAFKMVCGESEDDFTLSEAEKVRAAFKGFKLKDMARYMMEVEKALNCRNPEFGLSMMTLRLGNPDIISDSQMARAITPEEKNSTNEYLAIKKQIAHSDSNKTSEATLEDIASQLQGIAVVDGGLDSIPNIMSGSEDFFSVFTAEERQ